METESNRWFRKHGQILIEVSVNKFSIIEIQANDTHYIVGLNFSERVEFEVLEVLQVVV